MQRISLGEKWRRVGWALALTMIALGLAGCSGLGDAPTLVPTLALPTPLPRPTATSASIPSVSPPAIEPALVLAYDFDPATGQMAPADRLSGVTVGASDQLWVMAENAFVAYRREPSGELTAQKVITYTYDDIGRRVGWTITWPQGPTQTQRLVFLYEGLVAVGERLEVGDVVTTTYYPWAARDRNTTLDDADLVANAPITDVTRYDERCRAAIETDCVTMLARIVVSEASVGNEEEQRAVAWTFRNRLDRGLSLLSYAMDYTPSHEWYFELAREVLTAPPEADVTKGATHFFSPRSMPRQGQEDRCKPIGVYDCDGGLVFVEGLDTPAYAPFWHLLYEWLPVAGIRKTHFLFYRIPPIRPRVGQ
jgi:YD repeat-containing protein